MKVVPEVVLTCPLVTVREPQSTAVDMNTVNTVYTVAHVTHVYRWGHLESTFCLSHKFECPLQRYCIQCYRCR